jgi:hypothetical protein
MYSFGMVLYMVLNYDGGDKVKFVSIFLFQDFFSFFFFFFLDIHFLVTVVVLLKEKP